MSTAAAEIAAVHRQLPEIKCKGLCQECCGPIGMTRIEWDLIVAKLDAPPPPTDNQSLFVPREFSSEYSVYLNRISCPFLKDGRCSVYQVRPLICRLWGVTQSMRCPWGCTPQRWLPDRTAHQLLDTLDEISAKHSP